MLSRKRRLLAAALALLFILVISLMQWQSHRSVPLYRVTDLGVLPGCTQSEAIAVNSRGDVILSSSSPGTLTLSAGLYQGGKLHDLAAVPGASGMRANGINSRGDVVGDGSVDGVTRTLLYHNGKMQDIAILVGSPYSEFMGGGIDDRGEIAGTIFNDNPKPGEAGSQFFLVRNGKMDLRGVPGGYSDISAQGITAAGNIFGNCWQIPGRGGNQQFFIYDTRTAKMVVFDLPTLYSQVTANQGNDQGQVVGTVHTRDSIHAILWNKNRIIDMGAPPGYTGGFGRGLNNQGQAVGSCFRDDNQSIFRSFLHNILHLPERESECAFVYQNGKMQDLNELIPGDTDWVLEEARSINDTGQIVGAGLHHGQTRAFLLTPVR